MAVSLAPAALDRIRGYIAGTPGALGLRFGVRRSGCSGWGYAVDLARERNDDDRVFEQDAHGHDRPQADRETIMAIFLDLVEVSMDDDPRRGGAPTSRPVTQLAGG